MTTKIVNFHDNEQDSLTAESLEHAELANLVIVRGQSEESMRDFAKKLAELESKLPPKTKFHLAVLGYSTGDNTTKQLWEIPQAVNEVVMFGALLSGAGVPSSRLDTESAVTFLRCAASAAQRRSENAPVH